MENGEWEFEVFAYSVGRMTNGKFIKKKSNSYGNYKVQNDFLGNNYKGAVNVKMALEVKLVFRM